LKNGDIAKMEIKGGHVVCAKLREFLRRCHGTEQLLGLACPQRRPFNLMENPMHLKNGRFLLM
jgi:hypothetical protein